MRLPGMSSPQKGFAVPRVNLYPEDPFFASVGGRIMKWSVGAGRHIIIFTEMVVIVSFFSRFVLDRQLTDLNTSILQKQAVIESYGELETSFRLAQRQEEDIQAILNQQGRLEVLDILSQITPPEIKYDSISLSGGNLSLVGKTTSLEELVVLVENAKVHPSFQRVSVGRLESGNSREQGMNFTMNVIYTKGLVQFTNQGVSSGQTTTPRPSSTDAELEQGL